MSLLQWLPTELLQWIIDDLHSHRDVAHLSQQCRRFHQLCDMSTRREYHQIRPSSEPCEGTLSKLLSILKTPRLGTYVRYLELAPRLQGVWDPSHPEISLPADDLQRLKHGIKNAGFDRDTEEEKVLNVLLQAYRNYCVEQALAALIVSVSPRLETLGVNTSWNYIPKIWGKESASREQLFAVFLQRACAKKGDIPYMLNLRTVRFLGQPANPDAKFDPGYYELYDLNKSLNLVRRLPAIEEVSFDRVVERRMYMSAEPPPGFGNYSSIVLNNSYLISDCVRSVIQSARGLKKFVFGVGGLDNLGPQYVDEHGGAHFQSLFAHRDTLEHLDINLDYSSRGHHWVRYSDRSYRQHGLKVEDRETDEDSDVENNGDGNNDNEAAAWRAAVEFTLNNIETFRRYRDGNGNDRNAFKYESREEAQLHDLESSTSQDDADYSLRSFPVLKELRLGMGDLFDFACHLGFDVDLQDPAFSLADYLPPRLEKLVIYSYDKEQCADGEEFLQHAQIVNLVEEKEEKLPTLSEVQAEEIFARCVPDDQESCVREYVGRVERIEYSREKDE